MKKLILVAALASLSGCGDDEPAKPTPQVQAQGPHQFKVTSWVLGLKRGSAGTLSIVPPYYSLKWGSGGVYEELAACQYAGGLLDTDHFGTGYECIPYRVEKVQP